MFMYDINVYFLFKTDVKVKLEIARRTIDTQEKALAEKERECVHRVQGAREEEFEKLTRLENDK